MKWCILGVLLAARSLWSADNAAPISVCEALSHRTEYSSHLITVRGEVKGGGHGAWLVASEDCRFKLVTKGLTWSNIIYLTYPENRSPLQEDHADFQVDWKSIQKAADAAREARFDPEKDRIFETFVGLFVTYFDLENRVSAGIPGALKLGFGPVGLEAPAQLLIKSKSAVEVVRGRAK